MVVADVNLLQDGPLWAGSTRLGTPARQATKKSPSPSPPRWRLRQRGGKATRRLVGQDVGARGDVPPKCARQTEIETTGAVSVPWTPLDQHGR